MVGGTLWVRSGILSGTFNILVSLLRPVELTSEHLVITRLEGDAFGCDHDRFAGGPLNYNGICYLPEGVSGKSQIAIVHDDVSIDPIVVEYDTVRDVTVSFGVPVKVGRKVTVPLTLSSAIVVLRKSNVKLSHPGMLSIYGDRREYTLVMGLPEVGVLVVTVFGSVQKSNGVSAKIVLSKLEIN